MTKLRKANPAPLLPVTDEVDDFVADARGRWSDQPQIHADALPTIEAETGATLSDTVSIEMPSGAWRNLYVHLCDKGTALVGPLEGLGHRGVEVVNES